MYVRMSPGCCLYNVTHFPSPYKHLKLYPDENPNPVSRFEVEVEGSRVFPRCSMRDGMYQTPASLLYVCCVQQRERVTVWIVWIGSWMSCHVTSFHVCSRSRRRRCLMGSRPFPRTWVEWRVISFPFPCPFPFILLLFSQSTVQWQYSYGIQARICRYGAYVQRMPILHPCLNMAMSSCWAYFVLYIQHTYSTVHITARTDIASQPYDEEIGERLVRVCCGHSLCNSISSHPIPYQIHPHPILPSSNFAPETPEIKIPTAVSAARSIAARPIPPFPGPSWPQYNNQTQSQPYRHKAQCPRGPSGSPPAPKLKLSFSYPLFNTV